jgi:predicted transcriptional regulator
MVSKILTAISDDKSLVLFNAIALSSANSDMLIYKLGLTRKQYYSRMAALTNAGLISRRNGRHFLSSVGKVVYKAQLLIGKAKQNFWKLRAIDSIEASYQGSTMEEWKKVIDSLIQDYDLKEILGV